MRNKLSFTLGAVILAIGTGTAAYATQSGKHENDALADLAKAKISISQAIASAEQASPGKATRAELENENQGLSYIVEVADAATQKVTDVRVDGVTGKVLSAQADRGDVGQDKAD
ncbi:PepSY domain-containing protein [Sulfuriferula sp.]|uniref:PepSY domain-containing protein n=1 Tax=Sulfuriferula sp. TaxID=2025307 RepID=UPI00272FD0AA|nr:PepSY domain-containing protein [Sulfuriferula sp.]MDP2024689.1 PepSY domain-containing protein [Sulfuriferula sp.]